MENSGPLVSVVLCTYNGERYIRETIDSILSQTFHDFELIIWNDGSIDSTEQIIKSYNDSRIRYFYHGNGGVGFSLSLACKEVRGKYIARIDDDDLCMPDRLQKQVDYMESHPDCVLLSSSAYYIDENGNSLGRNLMCTWDSVIKKTLKVGSATIAPASMFRADVYLKTCGFQPIKCAEDRILWSRMINYGKFHNLEDALIKYRLRASSLSHIIGNNSYSVLLEEISRKLVSDEIISKDDIELYNTIYTLAKNSASISIIPKEYRRKVEERLFRFFSPFCGEKKTARILIFIKNIYCYLTK